AERQFIERRPGPAGIERDVYTVNPAFRADTDGPGTARPPPEHGAHSDEILSEIGYSAGEIGELRAEGVV
ncbi:MAG: CoA transferase, partial [Alphaproteobacteria bacterium]|nr:CoA transferase [Alphaproteobacteria bacterium]